MEKIFKGMDNGPEVIDSNFNELSNPNRDVTVNDLTVNGDIHGKSGATIYGGSVVNGLGSFKNGIYVENGLNSRDAIDVFGDIRAHSNLTLSGQLRAKPYVQYINVGKLKATLSRFGSSVFVSIDTQNWPYSGATAWTVAYDMVIPAGYRPVGTASMTMINNYKMSSLKVNSDGAIFFTDTDVTSQTNFEAYGTWITNDDWAN